jgi:hypothetical protein
MQNAGQRASARFVYRHLEIRFVCTRDLGVLSAIVFMRAFGADNLVRAH